MVNVIMKYFDFHRFVDVARWDLTINSKFYLRSSILVVALCCFPILMYYLYALLSGNYFAWGAGRDKIEPFVMMISLVGMFYSIIASGYMFHNLVTRQGRINELTLPATNLEKFVWHFLVIAVGTLIVFNIGVVCADLLHSFFRIGFGSETRSMTAEMFSAEFTWKVYKEFNLHGYYMMPLFSILIYSFVRTFSLVNAWKYKHNIPLTVLLHFLLNNLFGLIVLAIATTSFANPKAFLEFVKTLDGLNPDVVIISLYVFAVLLYCGILYLTYHLYTRAQLTTKRNP